MRQRADCRPAARFQMLIRDALLSWGTQRGIHTGDGGPALRRGQQWALDEAIPSEMRLVRELIEDNGLPTADVVVRLTSAFVHGTPNALIRRASLASGSTAGSYRGRGSTGGPPDCR